MSNKPRGSITVFICIVLAVLIPLCCIIMDVTRYTMAVKQAQSAVKLCADSMLAAYDTQLKDQYGLLAIYPRDVSAMEEEIFELMSENLNSVARVDGTSDLYGFKVKSVKVIPFYNLSEPNVLRQQVAEFMKYRAPIQAVQEFFEKIKAMIGLMEEGEMIEQKMSLDKVMNSIRNNLVNLHFMINLKLPEFNKNGTSGTLKGSVLNVIKINTPKASQEIEKANNEVNPIKEDQDEYIEIYPKYVSAKNYVNSMERRVDELNDRISNIDKEIDELESSNYPNYARINSLKADRADYTEELGKVADSLSNARGELRDWEEELESLRNKLNTCLSRVNYSLSLAIDYNYESMSSLESLLLHITRHEQYHTDLIAIIDELLPQLETLEKDSSKLLEQIQVNDGSVSRRIQEELKAQLGSIKRDNFLEIKRVLESNLVSLRSWKQACETCLSAIKKGNEDISYVLGIALTLGNEPQNENIRYLGYGGYGEVVDAVNSLESGLSELKQISVMAGVYEIPVYVLEPPPNSEEEAAFHRWFNSKYYSFEEGSTPQGDDTDLKEIREGVGTIAGKIGNLGEDEYDVENTTEEEPNSEAGHGSLGGSSGINEILSKGFRMFEVPSKGGSISSKDALELIGREIAQTSANQLISDNPFDKPSEGLDSVNEKEKNFFDYEMERMGRLLDSLRRLVVNGLESMVESLYLNEYIVSSFKCASTGEYIEHDIGWDRPLNQTYYDKGEVEYILFGKIDEEKNIAASKRSLFAIRLVFNLLHVYTDPDKLATTLSTATTIAGWTIFGVPVVQNFLLISWAGLESYVDTEELVGGESVPLIKTSASWYLGKENLVTMLKNKVLSKVRDFVEEKIDEGIDRISEAIEGTVTGIINDLIDKAFAAVEQKAQYVISDVSEALDQEITMLFDKEGFISQINFDNLDSLALSLESAMKEKLNQLEERLKNLSINKLEELKYSIKQKIRDWIFESEAYKRLVESAKGLGNDLLDKGVTYTEKQIDRVLGNTGQSRSNNITGRLIMMDYVDYLRLMLLVVPTEKKALRTADLMQLNLQEVSGNNELRIGKYNTYLYIKVELDMNTWFLPEGLFRKNNSGMITVEWSQGY